MTTITKLLKQGSRGPDVKAVQQKLNQKVPIFKLPMSKRLVEDGIFGNNTNQAVRTYQQLNRPLVVDGIVGKITATSLGLAYAGPGGGGVAPPRPPRGKPVFQEKKANNGFDVKATPPWQMVPLSGQKRVILKNADGLSVTSKNPAIATLTEDTSMCFVHGGREFIISGKAKGTTTIEVNNGPTVTAKLDVAVKRKKNIRVAFHFVEDNASHKTARNSSGTAAWIKTMNDIFLPQTNVNVTHLSAGKVKINKNLGAVVRFSSHLPGVPASEHEWNLVIAKGTASADFNVFFVWEYEQDINPNHDDTDAGTLGKNCIFEDNAGTQVGETLAHELGHTLGCPDTYTAADIPLLMYGITDTRGQKINKAHANIVNP